MYLLCAKSADWSANCPVMDGGGGDKWDNPFLGGNNSPAAALEHRGAVALGGRVVRMSHRSGDQLAGGVFGFEARFGEGEKVSWGKKWGFDLNPAVLT